MKFSYIIRTLNEETYLEELLSSLMNQDINNHEFEIIVVDSGSTDRTLSICRSNEKVNLVEISKSEFTFGKSLNIGCDAAKGDILFFISGHCVPTNIHWAASLSRDLIEKGVSYSFGRQIGRGTTKFSEDTIFFDNFPNRDLSKTGEVGFFCNNANAAILKSCWLKNKFDEEITGLEDLMLAKKIVENGGFISYHKDAVVFHIHDETYGQIRNRYYREAIALKKIFPEVHFTAINFISYFFKSCIKDIRRNASISIKFSILYSIILFRLSQFFGTFQGYKHHRELSNRMRDKFFYKK